MIQTYTKHDNRHLFIEAIFYRWFFYFAIILTFHVYATVN